MIKAGGFYSPVFLHACHSVAVLLGISLLSGIASARFGKAIIFGNLLCGELFSCARVIFFEILEF